MVVRLLGNVLYLKVVYDKFARHHGVYGYYDLTHLANRETETKSGLHFCSLFLNWKALSSANFRVFV